MSDEYFNNKSREEVDSFYDDLTKELAIAQTKIMFTDLGLNFSKETKLVAVPSGTKNWRVEILIKLEGGLFKKNIVISLIPFFDMYIGYNHEADILVYWRK